MISNEELMLYILKYPRLSELSIDHSKGLINDYKNWLQKHWQDLDIMDFFNLYLKELEEEEKEELYEEEEHPGCR